MKSKKSNKKTIAIILAVLAIIAFLVFRFALRPQAENYSEETAKTQDITTYYSFSGNIQSKDSQMVVSKKILPIKELYVKEGDMVKVGDVLFTLDDSNIATNLEQSAASLEISKINYEKMTSTTKQQQMSQVSSSLSTAKLNLENAKLNLERTAILYEAEGASKQALEQAQSGYDSAKLQLDSAQENYNVTEDSSNQNIRTAKEQVNQAQASYEATKDGIGDLTVTSEIDGVVSEIFVKENESLVTGTRIMDIIDYEDLEIIVKVDEFDIGAIIVGKEVSVRINTLEKDIVGIVSKISNQAQTINGVSFFTANIDLEKDSQLRVGLSAEIEAINKNEMDATTISMKALQFDNENQPFVYYRDANNKVITKPVTAGINDGNTVQIIEGVKSGEIVLLPLDKDAIGPSFGGGMRND